MKIVVGDVHGCREEFAELLQKVDYRPGRDDLIVLGDLLDRGPDPVGSVALAMEKKARLVQGNHEEKALRFLRHEAKKAADPSYKNPMIVDEAEEAARAAADSEYRPRRVIPPSRIVEWKSLSETQLAYLRDAPFTLDFDPAWLAVHAGFEPGIPLKRQKKDRVIRVRYVDKAGEMVGYKDGTLNQPADTVYWTEQWKGPQNVVYGHAVHSRMDPRVDLIPCGPHNEKLLRCIGIDTGCCFGGRLTAMILDEGSFSFVQVQAKQEYFPWPGGDGTTGGDS